MNIGDLSISLLLDNKQFGESIKTSLNLLGMFKKNADAILKGISPQFKSADFDKEISKGEVALNKLKDTAKKSDDALKQFGDTAEKGSVKTTKLAGVLTNVGLRFDGLRAVVSILKSTLGELFDTYNKFSSAQTGLSSIASFKGINPDIAKEQLQNIKAVKEGLLDIGNASTAFKNLLAANFTLEQSAELIDRLSNSAAFGRQASLSFGDAVASATEGIKNGNSILVDNAGVTKNLSIMLEEAGFKAQDLSKAGQDAGVRMAIFNGILRETSGQMGDVDKLADSSAGSVAKFDAAMLQLKVKFGEFISKAAVPFLSKATEVLKWLSDADPAIQKLALTIAVLSAAFVVLNSSMGSLPYLLISMMGLITALPPELKLLAVALGAVAVSMKLLNKDTLNLISGFASLGAKGASSVSGFATTAIGKFNAVGIAISLLIGWVTLLIGKISDLNDEGKNLEYWQNIRDNGGKIYMQTPDEKYDITDPKKPPQKTSTFQFNYVPGKGFVGQENSTGIQQGPEISSEMRDILKTDKQKAPKNTGGSSPKVKEVKEQLSRYAELEKKLESIKEKLILNAGYEGAINDLLKERSDLENEMEYVRSGTDLNKIREEQKELLNELVNSQIELAKLKRDQLIEEYDDQLKAAREIDRLKLEMMDSQHEKRLAQIEIERTEALREISERNIPDHLKSDLKKFTNDKFDNRIKEERDDETEQRLKGGIAAAQQIASILGIGADTFGGKFLDYLNKGLNLAESLVSLFLKIFGGGGGGGSIFGIISGIFGGGDSGGAAGASGASGGLIASGGNQGGSGYRGQLMSLIDKYAPAAFAGSSQSQTVQQVPYIASLEAKMGKLVLAINRENDLNNKRLV